jgi:hypothetical protein
MPNQNDSPPVLSGTAPAQPDHTLCKNIADLKITNNSGYEGLYVNFNHNLFFKLSGFTTLFPSFKNHTSEHIRFSDKQIRL